MSLDIYIVGSVAEASRLAAETGIPRTQMFVTSAQGWQTLEGRRVGRIHSTSLARQDPWFGDVLAIARDNQLRTQPRRDFGADFGLRSHDRDDVPLPTYLLN